MFQCFFARYSMLWINNKTLLDEINEESMIGFDNIFNFEKILDILNTPSAGCMFGPIKEGVLIIIVGVLLMIVTVIGWDYEMRLKFLLLNMCSHPSWDWSSHFFNHCKMFIVFMSGEEELSRIEFHDDTSNRPYIGKFVPTRATQNNFGCAILTSVYNI